MAAVLLAAGGSTRLGEPKALLTDADGVPRVVRVARDLAAAGCAPVLVVVGARSEAVQAALAGEAVTVVAHPGWAAGMGSSIAAGVAALGAHPEGAHAGALLVAPCDMPGATAAHLAWLVEASGAGMWRVASGYADGARGIPAVLLRRDWPALQALSGEVGARALLHGPDVAIVPLVDGDDDLDTPEAVAAWRRRAAPSPPSETSVMIPMLQLALADLAHELASTRRMLERLPDDRLDWRPHAKSFTLGQLADHLTDMPFYGTTTLTTATLDFAAMPPRPPHPATRDGFLAQWDARVAAFEQELAAATEPQLGAQWTATMGTHVVMAMPRLAMLRGMVVNHMIHHRAQLTMYYRLLDVPMPGMYGPSADEK